MLNVERRPVSTRTVVLLVGGTTLLCIAALVAGIFAVWTFLLLPAIERTVQAAVPAEFPVYPGATFGTGSVSTSDCTWLDVEWHSADSVAKVRSFYADRLANAPWQIVSEDDAGITFHGGRKAELWGRLTVDQSRSGSVIGLSGHTTTDAFGQRSAICDQLYPRGTPTPSVHLASP